MIIWDSSALQYLGNMTAAQRGYVNVIPVLCNYVGVLVASVSEKVVGQVRWKSLLYFGCCLNIWAKGAI